MQLSFSEGTQQLVAQASALCSELSVELVLNNLSGTLDVCYHEVGAQPVSEEHLARYLPIFLQEIRLYSRALFEQIKLRKINLSEQLHYAGQARAAVPFYYSDTMFYQIDLENRNYLINVFHHELFHYIDNSTGHMNKPDEDWQQLNPPGFRYGENLQARPNANNTAGSLMRDPNEAYKKFTGFRNNYSATAQEEDKAEIWGGAIMEPTFGHDDEFVANKARFLKAQMAERFPELGAQFWKRVDNLRGW